MFLQSPLLKDEAGGFIIVLIDNKSHAQTRMN